MEFGRSFSYIFEDKDWFKKLILPGLCMLIPVIGWMVALGWALQATRNVIDGVEAPLPDLDFGRDLGRGFYAFLIGFIYSLPGAILSGISARLMGFGEMHGEGLGLAIGALAAVIGLVTALINIVTSFITTTATANFVAKGTFGAGFKFDEIFRMLKTNFVDWLIVLLGTLLAVGIIGPLGSIACVVGLLVTLPFGLAVMGHLIGQAYVRSMPGQDVQDQTLPDQEIPDPIE